LYGLVSTKNEKILLEFLNTLEQVKDTDSIKRKVGKLLINSFYGRLAIGDEMFIIELLTDLGNNKSYGKLDDFFIIKKKIHKSDTKANIAIAAAIASKARIKLYEAQLEVQKHGGRLLYSDTDSIFAAFNKDNPVEDKLLGEHVFFDTKKNDTKIKDAIFISSKSYALKFYDDTELIKIKGINIKEIKFDELKYQFLSNNTSITLKNSQFSKKNFSLEHSISSKIINLQNYNKRIFINNKTDTIPIINN
jgi:DNA polymerase elongation subunit (family B)